MTKKSIRILESLKGPCTVKVTVKSLDGSWCGGESEFEYIDDPLTTEECLSNAVKSEHLRHMLFDIMHKEMSSNKPSDEQASSSSGKTGPGKFFYYNYANLTYVIVQKTKRKTFENEN